MNRWRMPSDLDVTARGDWRGALIFRALYRFQRWLKDGGWGYILPGIYMYRSQRILTKVGDDERIYLDELLGMLSAAPIAKRFRMHAQVAFGMKGVFPTGGAGNISLNPNCFDSTGFKCAQAAGMKSLAIAGPLHVDPADKATPKEFTVVALRGNAFLTKVKISLSNSPTFDDTVKGVVTRSEVVDLLDVKSPKGSPNGVFFFKPTQTTWGDPMFASLAQKEPRIYYMVEQCLVGGAPCVQSVIQSKDDMEDAGVPYVAIAPSAVPISCGPAMIARSGRGSAGWWILLALLAMTRRRSRR